MDTMEMAMDLGMAPLMGLLEIDAQVRMDNLVRAVGDLVEVLEANNLMTKSMKISIDDAMMDVLGPDESLIEEFN